MDEPHEAMERRIWIGLEQCLCAQLKRNDHGTEEAKPSMDGGVA